MKNSTYIQKKWMHFKVSTLSASITALVIAGIPNASTASDIDIYQAGGTGEVNIYFMLDASLSMGSMSLGSDYKYTSSKTDCNIDDIRSGYKYIKKDNGERSVTFTSKTNGAYKKEGNDYVFVNTGGNYNLSNDASAGRFTSSNTRYDRIPINIKVGTKCETVKTTLCPNNNTNLGKDLYVGSYIYAKSTDKACIIIRLPS